MQYLKLCLVFVLFHSTNIFGQRIIDIEDESSEITLVQDLAILETSENLMVKDILKEKYQQKFKKNINKTPNFGYSKSKFWLKFRLKNTSQYQYILELAHPFIDYVDFYIIYSDGTYLEKKVGGLVPVTNRDIFHHLFLFDLNLPENQACEVYLHLRGNSAKIFPLRIVEKNLYLEKSHKEDIFIGVYFGFFVVMILYNFFIFWSLKIISYLHYVLFISAFLALQFSLLGYIHIFNIFYYPHIANMSSLLFSPIVVFFGIRFARSFLEIKSILPKLIRPLQILDIVAITLFILGLLAIPFSFILSFLPRLNSYTMLLAILVLLTVGVMALTKKYRPARFYMLAWSFLLIGGGIYVLRNAGILPSTWFTLNAVRFGSVMEVLLLSLGLADRFRLAERAKQAAQKELITALKKNEKLILEQKETLEEKVVQRTEELTRKNKNIMSSIVYAEHIQQGLLPLTETISQTFPKHFIFFQPRDVVSGDFYWFYKFANKALIAVVDCTGHGVPGAFMSVLGNSLLNQIVVDKKIIEPNLVLGALHLEVRKALKQEFTNSHQGMEIAFCLVDFQDKKLYFSGARRPIFYIQNDKPKLIKGDIFPIGGEQRDKQRIFTQHCIDISQKTSLYLFSDGYQDQFGGERNKKFMFRNLKKLLTDIHKNTPKEQEDLLKKTFDSWGKTSSEGQIDDVLVMGIELE